MLKKLNLMILSAVSVFGMHGAEINVNNTDLELAVKFDMGQFNSSVEPDTVFFGAKYLNADKKHSNISVLNDYYELNFLMQKELSDSFRFGLGVKANYTEDFLTFPLGVEAIYRVPIKTVVPFYIGGSFYYAPDVLTGDNADGFREFRISLDAEAIENGFITLGYREIDTDYKTRDVEYNKSAYIGFRFLF